ncbi:MAG: cytochrome c4 [Gammaproteobacteria bacterium]|nr:cytochrome c4 [Gammaproteobacteria bacterium]
MMLNKTFAISLALLLAAPVQAAGNASAGEKKAGVCAGCHGPAGNSTNPSWPKLAGQGAGYIAKQLADFKSGARKDPIMMGQAAALSDQDMADLGAYYAKQTVSPGSADKKTLTLGQNVYRGGNKEKGVAACIGCHGPSGAGNPAAKFPALGSQQAAYIVKTMKDFRSGVRGNDPSKMMRDIAARMSDKEIEAVASYIAGLH